MIWVSQLVVMSYVTALRRCLSANVNVKVKKERCNVKVTKLYAKLSNFTLQREVERKSTPSFLCNIFLNHITTIHHIFTASIMSANENTKIQFIGKGTLMKELQRTIAFKAFNTMFENSQCIIHYRLIRIICITDNSIFHLFQEAKNNLQMAQTELDECLVKIEKYCCIVVSFINRFNAFPTTFICRHILEHVSSNTNIARDTRFYTNTFLKKCYYS